MITVLLVTFGRNIYLMELAGTSVVHFSEREIASSEKMRLLYAELIVGMTANRLADEICLANLKSQI